ncbi:MAG: hypothetical protein GY870_18905 [archaeon]|nr:hypothetical protein [archaeon]
MQIEQILRGKTVICELCGFEYGVTINDFRDIKPGGIPEPQNLYSPEDLLQKGKLKGFQKPLAKRVPFALNLNPFPINETHTTVNETVVLKALTYEWITLNNLARAIGINSQNSRDFYILRMRLNEMNRKNLIQMDFQINRVLIRKIRK